MNWSRKFDFCQSCKKTNHKHKARGYCEKCYPKIVLSRKSFICKECKEVFKLNYYLGNRTIECCSKKCSALRQRRLDSRYKTWNKSDLKLGIKDLIRNRKRYVGYCEVLQNLKVSGKTLRKYGISIENLNSREGYVGLNKVFENRVGDTLRKCVGRKEVKFQKTFDTCRSPKGNLLYFDYFIPSLQLIVEADGAQHYNSNDCFYTDEVAIHDNIKNNWAKENNILLARIKYKALIEDSYILNEIFLQTNVRLTTT